MGTLPVAPHCRKYQWFVLQIGVDCILLLYQRPHHLVYQSNSDIELNKEWCGGVGMAYLESLNHFLRSVQFNYFGIITFNVSNVLIQFYHLCRRPPCNKHLERIMLDLIGF